MRSDKREIGLCPSSPTDTGILKWPEIITHCDWSSAAGGRWMARAVLHAGHYTAFSPEPVGDLNTLISRVRNEESRGGAALAGFDFPIGIPSAYAVRAGLEDFRDFLKILGHGEWRDFYKVCLDQKEISLHRPFYPFNPFPKGSKRREHLTLGLGVPEFNNLLRTCELPQEDRQVAGALFWTLGAKAPGRGAIVGWRDVIAPALPDPSTKLWPFDGPLANLLVEGNLVIAETYPTQYYAGLFVLLPGSKRDQRVRASVAPDLFQWAEKQRVALAPELQREIESGFPSGDDAFDAVVGLFGMIEVVFGSRPAGRPQTTESKMVEGWILGMR